MEDLMLLPVDITRQDEGPVGAPGQRWVEITFRNAPVTLHSVHFANYYVHWITVLHSLTRAEGDPLLQVCLLCRGSQ